MLKLAIVVGHNAQAQGAVRPDTGETEFVWNSRLARFIEDEAADFPGVEVETFKRTYGDGYSEEIRRVYREVDAWGADYSCELHFNSHVSKTATGSEVLSSGSSGSLAFCGALQRNLIEALGLRNRGVKVVTRGRGGYSLIAGRAPAALIEPFFGSSPTGQAATDEEHEQRALARAILASAQEMFR